MTAPKLVAKDDGPTFKEDVNKHSELAKLEKEANTKNKADEERKLKQQFKEQQKKDKEMDRKKRFIRRENAEAKACNDLVLIYPLIKHKLEFFLEENYNQEEKDLLKQIDEKKEEILQSVDGDKKKAEK